MHESASGTMVAAVKLSRVLAEMLLMTLLVIEEAAGEDPHQAVSLSQHLPTALGVARGRCAVAAQAGLVQVAQQTDPV